MTSHLRNLCYDARDPYAQSVWWEQVLHGYAPDPNDPNEPDHEECALAGTDGTSLIFLKVPEGKSVKNRMHPCLEPADATRDEEVERVLGLGASMVADRRNDDGTGWAVLADPEGNEFCVLRSDAERVAVV